MTAAQLQPGVCRYCHCTEDNACRIPGGDACSWFVADRTVCNKPSCITAWFAYQRRAAAQADQRPKKRTPGQIHALMQEERRARRRAQRARKGRVA
jgi:hypothetical protein